MSYKQQQTVSSGHRKSPHSNQERGDSPNSNKTVSRVSVNLKNESSFVTALPVSRLKMFSDTHIIRFSCNTSFCEQDDNISFFRFLQKRRVRI